MGRSDFEELGNIARTIEMSPDQLRQQRQSFVYGKPISDWANLSWAKDAAICRAEMEFAPYERPGKPDKEAQSGIGGHTGPHCCFRAIGVANAQK